MGEDDCELATQRTILVLWSFAAPWSVSSAVSVSSELVFVKILETVYYKEYVFLCVNLKIIFKKWIEEGADVDSSSFTAPIPYWSAWFNSQLWLLVLISCLCKLREAVDHWIPATHRGTCIVFLVLGFGPSLATVIATFVDWTSRWQRSPLSRAGSAVPVDIFPGGFCDTLNF